MSLYGVFSNFLNLLLYGVRPGTGAQGSQSGKGTPPHLGHGPGHGARPQPGGGGGAPAMPLGEGFGQLGLILQALLGLGQPQGGGAAPSAGSGAGAASAGSSAGASAGNGASSGEAPATEGQPAQPDPAQTAASEAAQNGKANAAKGLENALGRGSNSQAQSMLEALLAQAQASPAEAAPSTTAPAVLAELSLSEDVARHLAEARVDAARQEEILRRVAAVAQPSPEGTPEATGITPQARNEAQAAQGLAAQLAALGAAQGAYSLASLVAVTPGAGFGAQSLRRAL